MRLGALLGRGYTYRQAREAMAGETLEAVEIVCVLGRALPGLIARGLARAEELPLLRALIDIVVHDRPVDLALSAVWDRMYRD